MSARKLTRDDILPMEEFMKIRADKRRELLAIKQNRRVPIGPFATFYFENRDTMWWQIHEMLRIERGGEEQIADELSAYNPLIPDGRELVATLMFEIDDPLRRERELGRLGGVEETVQLAFLDEVIHARAEEDVDRTSAEGKASSVQFLHFPFNDEQIAKFRSMEGEVQLRITHPAYHHIAVLSEATRRELARDLDG